MPTKICRIDHESEIEKTQAFQIHFGKRIKIIRKSKNITQVMLCGLTGFHQNYISDIEKGKRNVTMRVVIKLAMALEMDIKDFF